MLLTGHFPRQLDLLRIAAGLMAFRRQGLVLVQIKFCSQIFAIPQKVLVFFSRGHDCNSLLALSFRPQIQGFVL